MSESDSKRSVAEVLGPGLVTGAADDDPSGIGTYSQVGAQFGYGLAWTMLFSYPFLVSIQMICAEIGAVTGHGIAHNLRRHYPRKLLIMAVTLLLVANTINLGADLGAMAAALNLLVPGPVLLYAFLFGLISVLLEVLVSYERYVRVLKWTTLSLLAYIAVPFAAGVDIDDMLRGLAVPNLSFDKTTAMALVAVMGTTISPYLFFWQAAQEVEDRRHGEHTDEEVRRELARIRLDTTVGMAFSNGIAFCIMLSTAATLFAAGVHDIQTSAQAAEALRPVAGEFTFLLFGLGIIGTGMLAVPVLAGSAAYAVAGAMGWHGSLTLNLRRGEGRAFYSVIAAATVIGIVLCFTPMDPVKELFWSAVLNGVVAVPIMAVLMRMATNPRVMGRHVIGRRVRWLGWAATAVMGLTVAGMFVG